MYRGLDLIMRVPGMGANGFNSADLQFLISFVCSN